MIKVRGWQVSPAELEAALLLHPDISDAAVVGTTLPDTESEVPRGYIVKSSPHADLTEHDVREFMSTLLARYKNLDGGVVFVDSIPKSSAGKILRKALKDRALVEVAQSAEITAMLTTESAPAEQEKTVSITSSDTGLDGRSRATSHATTSSSRSNVTADLPTSSPPEEDMRTKEGEVIPANDVYIHQQIEQQDSAVLDEPHSHPPVIIQDPTPSLPQTLPPMPLKHDSYNCDLPTTIFDPPDTNTEDEEEKSSGKNFGIAPRSRDIRA